MKISCHLHTRPACLSKDECVGLFLEKVNNKDRLAKDISVPPIRISQIIHGKRAISAHTALRFAKYFGNSAEFWLNLQNHYDLEIEADKLKSRLTVEVKVLSVEKPVHA